MIFRLPGWYILDEEHRPTRVSRLEQWAEWSRNHSRVVQQDELETGVMVSTVFLGLDHRHFGKGPPILFETIVFGINEDDEAFHCRYSSWDDAVTGHAVALRKVKELIAKARQSTMVKEDGTC